MTEIPRKFNLSPDEAIAEMHVQLEKMRGDTDREQLKDMNSDTAYEQGYEVALFDYAHLTGPDPREIGVVSFDHTSMTATVTTDQ